MLVAHRLSTVKDAHKICVLGDGQVDRTYHPAYFGFVFNIITPPARVLRVR